LVLKVEKREWILIFDDLSGVGAVGP